MMLQHYALLVSGFFFCSPELTSKKGGSI